MSKKLKIKILFLNYFVNNYRIFVWHLIIWLGVGGFQQNESVNQIVYKFNKCFKIKGDVYLRKVR